MIAVAEKYLTQQRTATGIETIAELPVLVNGKVDINWLPVVGFSGAAVISEGSNSNGWWVRLVNGLQICIFKSGNLGSDESTLRNCVFPATFISKPEVYPAIDFYQENRDTTKATGFVFASRASKVGLSSCEVTAISLNGVPLSNGQANLLAIGYWK